MTVLITGASGFIGRRLIERLAAYEQELIAVSRHPMPEIYEANSKVHWVNCDLETEELKLSEYPYIDTVVHLAGATLGAGTDESLFFRANEMITMRLCQSLEKYSVKFIYASSQVVYGDAGHLKVTNAFPLIPESSAYACSKVNSENWLRWFYQRNGGMCLSIRFCGFIEGGGIVDYIVDRAIENASIALFSEGKVHRDYLSLNDGVDILIAAMSYQNKSGFITINAGSGQAVSASELASNICDEIDSTSHVELLDKPAPQGDFVFCIDDLEQRLNFKPNDLIQSVRTYARQRNDTVIKSLG